MKNFDKEYCIETFQKLLAVDSTTGQYRQIQDLVCAMLDEMGYPYQTIRKGGIIADLGGGKCDNSAETAGGGKCVNSAEAADCGKCVNSAKAASGGKCASSAEAADSEGNALAVTAHLDDIGLMVRHINANGTINVCPVGGLYPFYCVTENVRIYTRDGKVYTGTVCRTPNSIHVTEEELRNTLPDFRKDVCVVLDEPVSDAEGTRKLGIDTGDVIALEPRFTMAGDYLKSRFVDDKACAAVLLTFMKALKEEGLKLNRKVYAYFAMYEEIGHGTSWLPEDVRDMLAIDIAPTGPEQKSDERKVSIFAKDSRFPYHWEMTSELREAAIRAGVDYVMDIFTPHYGTDCDVSITAGYDIRHAAIGPGTANSHGYERTHIDGLKNTYALLAAYLTD